MTEEFNLSEKMNKFDLDEYLDLFTKKDVKEFIKRLKEEIKHIKPKPQDPATMLNQGWIACCEKILYEIDKLAGSELADNEVKE